METSIMKKHKENRGLGMQMNDNFIRKISVDWNKIEPDSFLCNIPALHNLHELEFKKNTTFFVGGNGAGKSTLLEAIAVAYGFNPEGGTLNYRFNTYDEVSEFSKSISITKGFRKGITNYFFRAESFFNVASHSVEYGSTYGGRFLHEQSHGEGFLAFFQEFDKPGLYIMDEPEAALSPQRQLALFIHIAEMAKGGAQFIITSHSPILLGLPEAEIISFENGKIERCSYEDTESYQVTEMFINNREILTKRLLSGSEREK
jgi:Predicted ATPase